MKDDDQHAFPTEGREVFYYGMTLRDYFAAKAMQGLSSNQEWLNTAGKRTGDAMIAAARASYEMADAMLEARK